MVLAAATTVSELRFRAMGTDVQVTVVGGHEGSLTTARDRIAALEARWSRFRDSSEISTLNRNGGRPVIVSPETFDLVARAIGAWEATGGRFDPTTGEALAAHGYDRDFALVAAGTREAPVVAAAAPGAGGIELIPELNAITLPTGTTFDPGGIAKGLAADLVVSLLLESADGALVDIGGDLRAAGRAPSAEGWVIAVPDPQRSGREMLKIALAEGGVATSSRLIRRWKTNSGWAHHLMDPATGRPIDTEVVAVTVVATEAWRAEVWTKALFLAGPEVLDDLAGVHAVVVTADGVRHATPGLREMLR